MLQQLTSYAEANVIESIAQNTYPQSYEHQGTYYPRVSSVTSFHPDSLRAKLANNMYSSRRVRIFFHRSIIGDHVHAAAAAIMNDTVVPTINSDDIQKQIEAYELNHTPDTEELTHRIFCKDKRSETEHIHNAMNAIIEQIQEKIALFLQWRENVNPRLLLPADTGLIHTDLEFSGTPDLVVNANGRNMVIDLKCGKQVHEVNKVQLEAYRNIIESCYNIQIDSMHVLLLGSRYKKNEAISKTNPYQYELYPVARSRRITTQLEHCIYKWHGNFSDPSLLAHTPFTGLLPVRTSFSSQVCA